jgi:hypothetical protein
MKPAAFAVLALLGLLALCACVSRAATSDYSLSSVSPPKVSLALASVEGATVFNNTFMQPTDGFGYPVNTTLDVGSFSFPFYNQTITQFTLNFQGFLSFGDTSDDRSTASGSITPLLGYDCPLPLNTSDGRLPAFTRGFAWAWSDYDWSLLDATLAYKVFAAGSCPFAPKAAESCLVIQSTSTPYYTPGSSPTGLGTVTAFVFSSGDFLVQVNSTVDSTWGHGGGDLKGIVFGIQDLTLNKGVTFPSAQSCNVTNTFSTWEEISAATGIEAGDTFGFYITAPCTGRQIVRPNGIGCYTKPSTSAAGKQASAAWINALAALF